MKIRIACLSAFGLASCAGLAVAAPTIDGKITDAAEATEYGAPIWVQTNPTQFGDAGAANPCDPMQTGGDPALVTTGVEFAIPLANIGSPAGDVRLVAFINGGGHDYASNQFLPSLPAGTGNLGGDGAGNFTGTVGGINLTTFAGTQHASVTPSAGVVPTIDGTLDAGVYGAPLALQANRTGFGNATSATQNTNGSELDAMYAVIRNGHLYVFLAGNMEANFNKLEFFVDSVAGGQNVMVAGNPNVDFDALSKFPGFTFDAGFDADYYITFGCGNATADYYPNYVDLGSTGTPSGAFLGCNVAGNGSGVLSGCGGPAIAGLDIALNNLNVDGVAGTCPPPAGNVDVANGSELDSLYARVDTTTNKLYLLLTGNIENSSDSPCASGGNKINLFIDADAADGQNELLPTPSAPLLANVDIAYGNLDRMQGMKFDSGFSPDYWMSFKTQGGPGTASQVIDAAVLRASGKRTTFSGNAMDYGAYSGSNKPALITFGGNFSCYTTSNPGFSDPMPQDDTITNLYTSYAPRSSAESLQLNPLAPVGTPDLIMATVDNSNIGGVTNTSAANAASATTGLEIAIDLDELGWDGESCIKIGGFVANGDATFMSNQVIGGLPASFDTANLGNVDIGGGTFRMRFDFTTIAGDQFASVDCGGGGCYGACVADFDDGTSTGTPDGGVTIDDLLYYLGLFDSGDTCADVDDGSGTNTLDGGVTIDDLIYYLARFDAGC